MRHLLLPSAVIIAHYIWKDGVFQDMDHAFRNALFHVISVAPTTGYATTDYGQWPMFAVLWMLFLCSFATSAGSTGGGIKMVRALLLYKQVYRELLRAMHPSAIYHVRVGGKVATQPLLFAVLAFGFIYMVCIVSLTLVMSFTGLDIVTALPVDKVMSYQLADGETDAKLVRPVHSLVALHGSEVVNVSALGHEAGRHHSGPPFPGRKGHRTCSRRRVRGTT